MTSRLPPVPRRRLLPALIGVVALVLAGCAGAPSAPSAPTEAGTVTISATNEGRSAQPAGVTLRRGDAVVGEMSADAVCPGETVRFSARGTDGPLTVTVSFGSVSRAVEWSPADCERLDLEATLTADGRHALTETCPD